MKQLPPPLHFLKNVQFPERHLAGALILRRRPWKNWANEFGRRKLRLWRIAPL